MFINSEQVLNSYLYIKNKVLDCGIAWQRWCNLVSIRDCGSKKAGFFGSAGNLQISLGPGSNPGRRPFKEVLI